MRIASVRIAVGVAVAAAPCLLGAQQPDRGGPPWPSYAGVSHCRPATGDAHALLDSAWHAMGLDRVGDRVVHYEVTDIVQQNYQSDRAYPPFVSVPVSRDVWFDPASGMERETSSSGGVFGGYRPPPSVTDRAGTYVVTDTALVPNGASRWPALSSRPLNAWLEVGEFRASDDVHVVARCEYRDYPRVALARRGAWGEERLLLDPKTDLPVAMLREEPHYLWGQQQVAYVYSLWDQLDARGGLRPRSAARITDGGLEVERLEGSWTVAARDDMPTLPRKLDARPMPPSRPTFLRALPVDTATVAGGMRILRNPGYAEGLTMVRDTVYLLDATQSEARSRLDSAWIARLYPNHRAVVVVVTDVAWPHVSGVRFWVARGATIVSHRASEALLRAVVDRRWTMTPDLLETERRAGRTPNLRLVVVSDSLTLAGGAVRLYPIDGIASEGALMVYMPQDRALWASDYVQTLRAATEYAREVWRAAVRHGLAPLMVAAEHIAPAPWSQLERLVSPSPPR